MTSGGPAGAVELLERALGYTRGALLGVTAADLSRPTPCTGWSLDALLVHMDDALDAFTEGADGSLSVEPSAALETRVGMLQVKACALLGAWTTLLAVPGAPPPVVIGGSGRGLRLPVEVVAAAAALEIALHGWDVGRATGRGGHLPRELAAGLLPVATALIADDDRGTRFSRARPCARDAPADVRLLAFAGRDRDAHGRLADPPGRAGGFAQIGGSSSEPASRRRSAS